MCRAYENRCLRSGLYPSAIVTAAAREYEGMDVGRIDHRKLKIAIARRVFRRLPVHENCPCESISRQMCIVKSSTG
jgi:hypothetical protein